MLKQKLKLTQFLRRPFQFSVNEVFRMKAEHFSFKMKVLAISKLAKQSQKTPFCSDEKLFMANIYAVYCAVKLVLLRKGRVMCDDANLLTHAEM